MQSEINSLKERVERNEESIDILIANTNTEVERLRDYIENVSIISDGQNEEILEKIESLSTVLETLKKNVSDTDEDRIAEIEALEDELDALRENLNKIDGRASNYYHINPATGVVETHDFGTDYVKNESGHYHECKVCGYKTDVGPHYYLTHRTNLDHQYYCEDCGYVRIDEPHSYTFSNFDTTEEEWYEDYPTLTDYHVRGGIYGYGSWAWIKFPSVPNLRRDTNISIRCDECGEETYKVVDDGAGTGEYLLTYAYTVTHEVILEDTSECVLRIGDMNGKRYIYLKNYSVTAYDGALMKHKWEVTGNTYREYGFEGQIWGVVDEAEVSEDKNIFKCADWNGGAEWGTAGYVIEGDIYYMGFGNGYRTSRVGFLATENGWVETEYGDDYLIYEELY